MRIITRSVIIERLLQLSCSWVLFWQQNYIFSGFGLGDNEKYLICCKPNSNYEQKRLEWALRTKEEGSELLIRGLIYKTDSNYRNLSPNNQDIYLAFHSSDGTLEEMQALFQ